MIRHNLLIINSQILLLSRSKDPQFVHQIYTHHTNIKLNKKRNDLIKSV
jgi:hypothetical protein